MNKLPALTPDDPLRAPASVTPPPPAPLPHAEDTPAAVPAAKHAPRRRRPATRRAAPATQAAAQPTSSEQWSGATDVTTFRLPAELLQQLHQRSRDLGLAKGMTVAAALLDLFQRDDDELVQLVEQTQQRYDTARRRARRAA